jgi:Probable lipoprotein LpqN
MVCYPHSVIHLTEAVRIHGDLGLPPLLGIRSAADGNFGSDPVARLRAAAIAVGALLLSSVGLSRRGSRLDAHPRMLAARRVALFLPRCSSCDDKLGFRMLGDLKGIAMCSDPHGPDPHGPDPHSPTHSNPYRPDLPILNPHPPFMRIPDVYGGGYADWWPASRFPPPTGPAWGAPGTATPPIHYQTIEDYVQQNGITEITVHRGDAGAPVINLPCPAGWTASANIPAWAYTAMFYTGPEAALSAATSPPSIVAKVSKFTGNVDAQAIIDRAPRQVKNLNGFHQIGSGSSGVLDGYAANELGGTWVNPNGEIQVVHLQTAIIPSQNGLYMLQLWFNCLSNQMNAAGLGLDEIDTKSAIVFPFG